MVEPRQSSAARLAAGSVAVAVAVLALKAIAWWVTGSVALYADALESIVNVAAALAALLAVRLSALPADANHPYGHSKAEYLSAVLEGALIIVAALLILHETWAAYLAPRAPEPGHFSSSAVVCSAAWALRHWSTPSAVCFCCDAMTNRYGRMTGLRAFSRNDWLHREALEGPFAWGVFLSCRMTQRPLPRWPTK